MDTKKLAQLCLPNVEKDSQYYIDMYKPRGLKEGAKVTRVAPSPTGYLHLGTLYTALVNKMLAQNSEGVFYTRIEDTDKKREIEGGIKDIIDGIKAFGIEIDEGFVSADSTEGEYGPYKQSERGDIYRSFVKDLIEKGYAYPCFCSAEDLSKVREEQEAKKEKTGYYGKYAKCRELTLEEIEQRINNGDPFVIRLKSPGTEEKRINFVDGVKGKIEMPENDEDFVLLKTDGIPTYHFAHAIDDHLMGTTIVIRGDEWISSTPKHLQLFYLLGFKAPKYAHISPIMKLDDGKKRKISKRKDPEAAVRYFIEQGFMADSVMEYLMTIISSEFEQWRKANKTESYRKFNVNLKKMSVSGALFDFNKLLDVAKGVVSKLSADEVVDSLLVWSKEYDSEFYNLLNSDVAYAKEIFSIDRGNKNPRKDIAKWSDAKNYCSYFYDECYSNGIENFEGILAKFTKEDIAEVLSEYSKVYTVNDDKQEWFDRIKATGAKLGFADDTKAYKAAPDSFKGSPADVSTIIRIAVTGRQNTPDLWSIMKLLGEEKTIARINESIGYMK